MSVIDASGNKLSAPSESELKDSPSSSSSSWSLIFFHVKKNLPNSVSAAQFLFFSLMQLLEHHHLLHQFVVYEDAGHNSIMYREEQKWKQEQEKKKPR
ncbi:hypothetical protein C5167_007991 [Papaver somniferum]|uniref:Uncharacterized protein n=1 Tax=Papaver somniferum TaxID=3469 RepID=A0A4Y7JW60_PAPSO|nr:hypothetical protein C5167_007991 [Papaver somniferum]